MKKLVAIFAALLCSVGTVCAQDWQYCQGYRGFVDLGGVIGTGDCGSNAFTVSTTHGYQFVPSYLFVGAGIGANLHNGGAYLPIYADLHSQLPTGKWSPFLDARLGYAGCASSDWEFSDGGLNFNPSIGVSLAVGNKIGLELSVGYVYQNAVVMKLWDAPAYDKPYLPNNEYKIRRNIGGINIRFGVTF